MIRFQQKGDSLQLIAPTGGVIAGQAYAIGGLSGVVLSSASEGDTFTLCRKGVFTISRKAPAESWIAGDLLYLANNDTITKESAGNMFFGRAFESASVDAESGAVLFTNYPMQNAEPPLIPRQWFGSGGPNNNVYDIDTGRQIYVQIPEGYTGEVATPLIIFLSGVDQNGTDVDKVLEDGLPQVIQSGQKMKSLVGCPQLTVGSWSEYLLAIVRAIEYMKSNYNVNSNRIYLSGLSDGASGVIAFLIQYGVQIAGYVISSPPANGAAANAATLKDIPGYLTVGLSDQRVGVGNTAQAIDAIAAQNGRIAPLSKFVYGTDHSRAHWNTHLFDFTTAGLNFEEDLLYLWSLDRVDEANSYVVRAERTADFLHFLEAQRIVNALAASSDKAALTDRLSTLEVIHNNGKRRWLIAFGTSAYPATGNYNKVTSTASGTTVSNLIDMSGNATALSVSFNHTQWDADLPGRPGSYHGFNSSVFAEARRIYALNDWAISGTNDSATYRADLFPYYKTENGTAHFGITGTIAGIVRNSVDDVYNVMDKMTWEGVLSQSGQISMQLNAQYPDAGNDAGLVAILITETL